MIEDNETAGLIADFDDISSRSPRHPLISAAIVGGSLFTVIAMLTVVGFIALGYDFPRYIFEYCAAIGLISIPFLMRFWYERVRFGGRRWTVVVTVLIIAVFCWVAEVFVSILLTKLFVAVVL